MNKKLFALFAFAVVANAQQYSEGIRYAVEQLRIERREGMPLLEGYSIGYPGRQGTFVLLWPYFFARGSSPEDVRLMIRDKSALVRIMGARRVLEAYMRPLPVESIEHLSTDEEMVLVGPLFEPQYHFAKMTVAQVVKRMKDDPSFLLKADYGELVVLDYIRGFDALTKLEPKDLPKPVFPLELARAGISGDATVKFTILKNGSTQNPRSLGSTQKEFELAAMAAVAGWRCAADVVSGPKEVEVKFVFRFRDE